MILLVAKLEGLVLDHVRVEGDGQAAGSMISPRQEDKAVL